LGRSKDRDDAVETVKAIVIVDEYRIIAAVWIAFGRAF
jgi:hypothetical protein